jgi:hypothetical protein
MAIDVPRAVGAELIDNPQYKAWANYKIGTRLFLRQAITEQGKQTRSEITQELIEITPEKVVIEIGKVADLGKHEGKPRKEIPAKIEKGRENLPHDFTGTSTAAGQESPAIAGRRRNCTIYEFAGENERGKFTGKLWATDEIPGGIAKVEMKREGGEELTISLQVEAIQSRR